MKIDNTTIGKRVHIRLRVGGSYTGTLTLTNKGASTLKLDDGHVVTLQNGMIASLEIMDVE